MLIRKDPGKGNHISNFRLITLLNVKLKILAKILAKRLTRVTEKLKGKAQTCAMPGSSVHDIHHVLC